MPRALAILAFSAVLLASVPSEGLGAQAAPRPAAYPLPAEERFVYARKVGDKQDEVEITTRLVSDTGAAYCELVSRSPDQEALFRLDPESLFATYSDITTRGRESTLRRVTSVLENRIKLKEGEILVSDAESLTQALRLFPWGSQRKARLLFVGSGGGGNFSFELSVSGREKVTVAGRETEAWKAQLGLSGLFGSMMGKTSLWYSTDYPARLLKSEGPSAGPGSPNSAMELVSYASSGPAP
jgi:hypothetical protein